MEDRPHWQEILQIPQHFNVFIRSFSLEKENLLIEGKITIILCSLRIIAMEKPGFSKIRYYNIVIRIRMRRMCETGILNLKRTLSTIEGL